MQIFVWINVTHSRSKFSSTSSNIINTQQVKQIKHPSDILNFTSRRNILFSRIFNSSISLSFNNYNDTFSLHHLSFTPRTKEKRSRFFRGGKKGSRHPLRLSAGNPDPIFPCRRVPLKAEDHALPPPLRSIIPVRMFSLSRDCHKT